MRSTVRRLARARCVFGKDGRLAVNGSPVRKLKMRTPMASRFLTLFHPATKTHSKYLQAPSEKTARPLVKVVAAEQSLMIRLPARASLQLVYPLDLQTQHLTLIRQRERRSSARTSRPTISLGAFTLSRIALPIVRRRP